MAACMACTVEYTPSVYSIASTRDGLYLDKEAEMACETPLEADKVRVDTYSDRNRVRDNFLYKKLYKLIC